MSRREMDMKARDCGVRGCRCRHWRKRRRAVKRWQLRAPRQARVVRYRVLWGRVVLAGVLLGVVLAGAVVAAVGARNEPNETPEAAARAIVVEFRAVGATREEAAQALAVAWHESRWRPWVRNPKCCAAGLFQITLGTWNRYASRSEGLIPLRGERTDIEENRWVNARVAARIWNSDRDRGYFAGWGQWSVVNEAVEPGQQAQARILRRPLSTLPEEMRPVAAEALADVYRPRILQCC